MAAQHFNSNLCEECQGIFRGEKRNWSISADSSDWQLYPHYGQSQTSWVKTIASESGQTPADIETRSTVYMLPLAEDVVFVGLFVVLSPPMNVKGLDLFPTRIWPTIYRRDRGANPQMLMLRIQLSSNPKKSLFWTLVQRSFPILPL
jgi:hypothetical protein